MPICCQENLWDVIYVPACADCPGRTALTYKTARAGGGSTGNGSRGFVPRSPLPGFVQVEPLHRGPDERAEYKAEVLAERRAREADDAELRRVEG